MIRHRRGALYGLFFLVVSVAACSSSSPAPAPDTGNADPVHHQPADPGDSGALSEAIDASPLTPDGGTGVLAMTDGMTPVGFYCGKNPVLKSHVIAWSDPTYANDSNLFYVDAANLVHIEGYCTAGCKVATTAGAPDQCVAPAGAPASGKECFNGPGKYCGHTLGIAARTYPASPAQEGLFSCDAKGGVTLSDDCACQVNPGVDDSCASAPGGARKLYIAYETAGTCVADLKDFFHCMLERTNFTALATAYTTGYGLAFGAMTQVPASCGTSWQCAVDNAHFPIGPLDVVLIVSGSSVGGMNNWDINVNAGGHPVHIHGAFIGDGGGSCAMQTAYAMHEVYEATSDPASADCCDGEVPTSFHAGCLRLNDGDAPACAKWGPTACGGDGSYGLATIDCGGGKTYTYQRVSPANDEYGFHGATCLPIAVVP